MRIKIAAVVLAGMMAGPAGAINLTSDLSDFAFPNEASRKADFDRRMREEREEAALAAERQRLREINEEQLAKERKARNPPPPPPPVAKPDLSKYPSWAEVERSAKYFELGDYSRLDLRAAYFDDLMAPFIEDEQQRIMARAKFMAQEAPWTSLAQGAVKKFWMWGAGAAILALLFILRAKIAAGIVFVVSNAFRIAALAAAVACVAVTVRALQGPLFVFLGR